LAKERLKEGIGKSEIHSSLERRGEEEERSWAHFLRRRRCMRVRFEEETYLWF
jgi:hypothetical protein